MTLKNTKKKKKKGSGGVMMGATTLHYPDGLNEATKCNNTLPAGSCAVSVTAFNPFFWLFNRLEKKNAACDIYTI